MPSVMERIKSRGYWRLNVRPARYVERRVSEFAQLQSAIEMSSVKFRGWDFPHVDHNWGPPKGLTWVGQEIDFSIHKETWRGYQSGQFIHYAGYWDDWMDEHMFAAPRAGWQPKSQLGVTTTLWSITEGFEFAARLSQTNLGDADMVVGIEFFGLRDRDLVMDAGNRAGFFYKRRAEVEAFPESRKLTRTNLLANTRELAIDVAAKLFGYFGWDADRGTLRSLQDELFKR